MRKSPAFARIQLITSMVIFGTLGIFVSFIHLSSATIVMVRAVIGTVFIGGVMLCSRQRLHRDALRQNAVLLFASGIALGLNWTLLFEAYRHTTVAVATLCYYMAPVFFMLLSPIVLKEPMTKSKIVCILAALTGAAMISGAAGGASAKGIVLGFGAAALYCAIMLMNRKMHDLSPMETTFIQLFVSALIITPYALIRSGVENPETFAALLLAICNQLPLLCVVGIVHTGIAYTLFFPSVNLLPSQTVAVFSYIDPVLAILLSALVLHQPLTTVQVLGAVLLLGASFVSERKKGVS